MLTSRRIVGALCVGALLATACSSGGAEPEDGATTDTASPVATETPSVEESTPSGDPWAVPDPITEEYVDRVVNTIYEEWGGITREILEQNPDPTGTTPVETRERIAELFGGEDLLARFQEADRALRGERGNLLPADQFNSVAWSTRRIVLAEDSCLVVVGDFDTSQTATNGRSLLSALSLESAPATTVNPTGWRVIDSLANTGEDGEVFDDEVMLEASMEDLGRFLEVPCES